MTQATIIIFAIFFYLVAWVTILNNAFYVKKENRDMFTFKFWIVLHIFLFFGIILLLLLKGEFL